MTPDAGEADYREVEAGPDDVGARLDAWLSDRLEVSRTRVQRWLAAGEVKRIDEDARLTKSDPVEAGSRFGVTIPAPKKTELVAEDLPLDIVFEDDDLAVVDKAAGMVVHPAPGHPRGTLVNALLHHLESLGGVGGRLRPGIVHRLDRETSGLLVVAKTDRAQTGLQDALRKRKVKRLYTAMTWGHIRSEAWPLEVDAPIGRDRKDRKRMTVRPDGRRAVTRLRVHEEFPAAQLLDIALQTGRTHQIRVHLRHLGHPIVGEPVYERGGALGISGPTQGWARGLERRTPRQFLHAAELAFDHPVSGERVHVTAPLPDDLAAALSWAREMR